MPRSRPTTADWEAAILEVFADHSGRHLIEGRYLLISAKLKIKARFPKYRRLSLLNTLQRMEEARQLIRLLMVGLRAEDPMVSLVEQNSDLEPADTKSLPVNSPVIICDG